jgi:hypothetical protein
LCMCVCVCVCVYLRVCQCLFSLSLYLSLTVAVLFAFLFSSLYYRSLNSSFSSYSLASLPSLSLSLSTLSHLLFSLLSCKVFVLLLNVSSVEANVVLDQESEFKAPLLSTEVRSVRALIEHSLLHGHTVVKVMLSEISVRSPLSGIRRELLSAVHDRPGRFFWLCLLGSV